MSRLNGMAGQTPPGQPGLLSSVRKEVKRLEALLGAATSVVAIAALFGYDRIPDSDRAAVLLSSGYMLLVLVIVRLVNLCRKREAELRAARQDQARAQNEYESLQQQMRAAVRIIEIEGFPLNTLMQFIADRHTRPRNNVRLSFYGVDVKLTGHADRKDATVTYRIVGTNHTPSDLHYFHLTIVGEGTPRLEDLHPVLYELGSDPEKARPLHPFLRKGCEDDGCKEVILPFPAPGIRPEGAFELEFSYTWPSTFRLPKDYWFLDNANVDTPAQKVSISLEIDEDLQFSGNVYRFEPNECMTSLLGEVTADSSQTTILFERNDPGQETFYLLIAKAHGRNAANTTRQDVNGYRRTAT